MTEDKSRDVELRKSSDVEEKKTIRSLSPFEEMDHLAARFFPYRWMQPFHTEWPSLPEMGSLFEGKIPKVDIIDRDGEVLIRAEVPGVDKKDLDVSVTDNSVSISGSTSHEEKEEKGDYYRSEISRGSFSRVVALPSDVDSDKAKSKFKDGVLELTIPKVKKAKRKKIDIA